MAATAPGSYEPQPQHGVQAAPLPGYAGAQSAGPSVAPASLALPGTMYAQSTAAPLPVMTAGGQVASTVPHGFATTTTQQEGARMLPAPFPSLAPMGPPASTIPLKLASECIPAFPASSVHQPTVTAGDESATAAEGGASAKKDTGTKPKVKRQEVPAAKDQDQGIQTTTAGRQPTTSTSREERPRLTARRRRSTTPLVDETNNDEVIEEDFTRKQNVGREGTPTEEVTLE